MLTSRILPVVILSTALFADVTFATPFLQLDIEGGEYIGADEESVMTDDPAFTLRALLTPSNTDDLNFWIGSDGPGNDGEDFLLSIAVVPQLEQTQGANYGYFTLNGTTINVTGDMTWGVPPLDDEFKDLPKHSAYPTYYYETIVRFDDTDTFQVATYNVQDSGAAGQTLTPVANGGTYVTEIDLDFSGITNSDFNFHFDLYHVNASTNKIDRFAPFSHDAETDFNNDHVDPGPIPVPEPGSLVIWGFGLALAGLRRRNKVKQAA